MLKDVHYSFKNKKQPKNPTIGEQVIKSWSTHWGRIGGGAHLLMLCCLESVLRKNLSEKLICTELPFYTRFS